MLEYSLNIEDKHVYANWGRREVGFIDDEFDQMGGFVSPPLWKTSPSRTLHHNRIHHRSLSPDSRSQSIARGQRELMDMVRNMPESAYELSLKDLVEHPMIQVEAEEKEEKGMKSEKGLLYRRENSKNEKVKKEMLRKSKSMDSGGLYLKMMSFPTSINGLLSKKKTQKKKNENGLNSSAKVSPKPALPLADHKSVSSLEANSRSKSNGKYRNSRRGGCWFCIRPKL